MEFDIDGQLYRATKLSVFQQGGVSKRIAPLIPPLIPIFVKLSKEGALSEDIMSLPDVIQPFAAALSELSDESMEYVIGTCLSVVKRKAGDSWVSIWNMGAKIAQFDELNDLSRLIPLVIRVIRDSLGNFMQAFTTSQSDAATAA